jgi:hypothetical protein
MLNLFRLALRLVRPALIRFIDRKARRFIFISRNHGTSHTCSTFQSTFLLCHCTILVCSAICRAHNNLVQHSALLQSIKQLPHGLPTDQYSSCAGNVSQLAVVGPRLACYTFLPICENERTRSCK